MGSTPSTDLTAPPLIPTRERSNPMDMFPE